MAATSPVDPLLSGRIQKTPGVCGGDACIRGTRIQVWLLVLNRKWGKSDAEVLDNYPSLAPGDLDAAWEYYRQNPLEIEQAIWHSVASLNVPPGAPVPPWVIVSGRLLGLTEEEVRDAFDPPLTPADVAAAWKAYRADPDGVGRAIAGHWLAG
jgi:uncharacterized protein (DUF433 family)